MKTLFLIANLLFYSFSFCQENYRLELVQDPLNNYKFTVYSNPNSTTNNADVISVGFSILLPKDEQISNIESHFGGVWDSSIVVTADQLSNLNIGKNKKDLHYFYIPVNQFVYNTVSNERFPLISFELTSKPNSGVIRLVDNDNKIINDLFDLGYDFKNYFNTNLNNGLNTKNYYDGNKGYTAYNLSDGLSLIVSPNPAINKLNLVVRNHRGVKIPIKSYKVYDINNFLKKEKLFPRARNNVQININNLPIGNYIIVVKTHRGAYTKQFIKQ